MNITIPPEALEAGARASYEDWVSICVTSGGVPEEYRAWDDLEDGERDEWRDHARAACLAMLRAWPGMKTEHLSSWVMEGDDLPYVEETPAIILPLPQEKTDANV